MSLALGKSHLIYLGKSGYGYQGGGPTVLRDAFLNSTLTAKGPTGFKINSICNLNRKSHTTLWQPLSEGLFLVVEALRHLVTLDEFSYKLLELHLNLAIPSKIQEAATATLIALKSQSEQQ